MLAIIMMLGTMQVNVFAQDDSSATCSENGTIIAVDSLEEGLMEQTVTFGTELTELNLPTELNAIVRIETTPEIGLDETTTIPAIGRGISARTTVPAIGQGRETPIVVEASTIIEGITWESYPVFDSFVGGTYTFSAVLPSGFVLGENVELPVITVNVLAGIAPRMGIVVNFNANGGVLLVGNFQRTTTTGNILGGTIGVNNMPIEPTRAGFIFSHWNTEQDGSGTAFTGNTVVQAVDAPVTVYAQWGVELLFNGNGVSLPLGDDPANPDHFVRRIVRYNDSVAGTASIVWPNNPPRGGHVFVGWFDTIEPVGGTQFTENSPITQPTLLFARWELSPILTVTFDPDGGNIAAGHTATRETRAGVSIRDARHSPHVLNSTALWSVTAPNATRPGMTLEGWWTGQGGTGTRFTGPGGPSNPTASATLVVLQGRWPAEEANQPVEDNMTVYANWVRRVTFNVNGPNSNWSIGGNTRYRDIPMVGNNLTINNAGTILYGAQYRWIGHPEPGMPPDPTRPGFVFMGWYTTSAATGGVPFDGDTVINNSMTVWARWVQLPNRPFEFRTNGGTFPGNTTTTSTTHIVGIIDGYFLAPTAMPVLPVRPGYVFMGWFTPGNYPIHGDHSNSFSSRTLITPALDVVYARWLPTNPVTFRTVGSPITTTRYVPIGFCFGHMSNVWNERNGVFVEPTRNPPNNGNHSMYRLDGRQGDATRPNDAAFGVFWEWRYGNTNGPTFNAGSVVNGPTVLYSAWTVGMRFNTNHTSVIPTATNFNLSIAIAMPGYSVAQTRETHDRFRVPTPLPLSHIGILHDRFNQMWPTIEPIEEPDFFEFFIMITDLQSEVFNYYMERFGGRDWNDLTPEEQTQLGEWYAEHPVDVDLFPYIPVQTHWSGLYLNLWAFRGFNTAPDGSGQWFHHDTPIPADATGTLDLFAIWYHGLTFHSGVAPSAAINTADAFLSVPVGSTAGDDMPEPYWPGLTFSHWNTRSNASGVSYDGSVPITQPRTLFAIWNAGVTFDSNGGSFAGGVTSIEPQVRLGGNIGQAMPPNPTRPGYTFNGWNTAIAGTGTNFRADGPRVDRAFTLFAQWTPIVGMYPLTVTNSPPHVDPIGQNPVGDTAVVAGSSVSLTAGTYGGYEFIGWTSTQAVVFADASAASTTFDMLDSPVTITANWQFVPLNYYPVTILNSGLSAGAVSTASASPNPATEGSVITLNAGIPPAGYEFVGWSTNTVGVAILNPSNSVAHLGMVDGGVTVTANWQPIPLGSHPISVLNAGLGAGAVSMANASHNAATPGTLITLDAGIAPAGYEFTGWTTATASVSIATPGNSATTFTMPDEAVTVTANWQPIPPGYHPITVLNNGLGAGVASLAISSHNSATTGTLITLDAGVAPAGYEFAGWTSATASVSIVTPGNVVATFTMPDEAVTVTANWQPIPPGYHPITVLNNGLGAGVVSLAGSSHNSATAGTLITLDAGIAPAGYEFTGWTTATANVTIATPGNVATTFVMPDEAVTVTANWQPIPPGYHPITVLNNGLGAGVASLANASHNSATAGTLITLDAGIAPAGYEFTGWTTATASVSIAIPGNVATTFVMPDEAVTVTANWSLIPPGYHPITVLNNGLGAGVVSLASASHDSATAGTTIILNAGSPPAGYVSIGWTTDTPGVVIANAGNNITTFVMIDAAVTVTANWQPIPPNHYPIVVQNSGLGAGVTSMANASHNSAMYGTMITLNAGVPPTGYNFVEWSTDTAGIAIQNAQNILATFVMIDGAVTITANWEPVLEEPVPDTPPRPPVVWTGTQPPTPSTVRTPSRRRTQRVMITPTPTPTPPPVVEIPEPEPTPAPTPPTLTMLGSTPYVRGFPDGTFRPSNDITRAEVTMALFNLVEDANRFQPIAGTFTDVQPTGWYAQAINYLAAAGILADFQCSEGAFNPNTPMTRAELTAVMSRFFEMSSGTNPFSDIQGHWAYNYINSAYNKGWINGYGDTTFRPDNPITRAEAVAIINRALDRRANPATIDYNVNFYVFSDITRTHWAYYEIMIAAVRHEFYIDLDGLEIWFNVILP